MRTPNIQAYFRRYAWAYEIVEPHIWRSSFATDRDVEFDLYILLGDHLLHFAVSPFVAQPLPACQLRLYDGLLKLNQQMQNAWFALDDEGDINLLASLPRRGCSYPLFAATLDGLTGYTNLLAHDAARLAREPNFHTPLIPTTLAAG